MTRYDCMSEEELAFWRAAQVARARALSPCTDCPLWFEAQARAAGCCNRDTTPERRAQQRAYSERLRDQWREGSRRYRARRAATIGAQS